jgi:putative ABC transport system permease protein
LGYASNSTFVVEGYTPPKDANMNLATIVNVEGDYLQTMGVPLFSGRLFTPDDNLDSPLVAIVNRKLAEHYWPNANPIGRRLRVGTPESVTAWLTVVGEVADVKEGAPDAPDKEQLYQPLEQFGKSLGALRTPDSENGLTGFITVRTSMEPEAIANSVREAVRSIDPQLALTQIQSMESAVSDSEAPRRFHTAVISAFALAAVLLAGLGIYSVIAFSAALRVQEMAIRMALGSQRSGILGLVFWSALKLALAGCAIGLVGAAAASHLLDSFLFGVGPFDPLVLALASLFVLILAVVATLIPARRAASIDPMKALRAD